MSTQTSNGTDTTVTDVRALLTLVRGDSGSHVVAGLDSDAAVDSVQLRYVQVSLLSAEGGGRAADEGLGNSFTSPPLVKTVRAASFFSEGMY